jgi:hypothetical protein
MMKYPGPFKREELSEDGYYWWLPAYLKDNHEKEECWSILLYSKNEPRFHYVGVFYGPIKLPEHNK